MLGRKILITAGLVACFGLLLAGGSVAQPRGEPADPGRGQAADANAPQAADADSGQAADQPQAADANGPQAADPARAADRPRPSGPVRPQGPVRPSPPRPTIALKTSPVPGAQSAFGELCFHKFNDLNGNGTFNLGEPSIPGIQFEIRDSAGVLVFTGTTNATGDVCTGVTLPQGIYAVTEVLPPGSPWVPGPFGLTSGALVMAGTLGIGNIPNRLNPTGQICLDKYNDLNGNGQRDPGEPPLAGRTFLVVAPSGSGVVPLFTTDAAGHACVNVPPGSYFTMEYLGLHPGWVSTDPTNLWSGGNYPYKPSNVAAGQTISLVFGNHFGPVPTPPSLTIQKLSYNHCSGAPGSTCVFEIRIRNTGALPYTGPLTFSDDTIPSVGISFLAVQMASGWTCSGSQPMTCTNPSVTIPAGGVTGLLLSVTISGPGWPNQNCASLTVPVTTAPSCATIESKYDLGVAIYPNPGGNSSTATNKTFVVRVQANQAMVAGTPLVVGGSLGPAGNFGSISTATPGWTCTGTAAAFQCTFTAGGGTNVEQFQLDAGSTAGGQPFTMTATISAAHNNDPYGTNNSATVSGILP